MAPGADSRREASATEEGDSGPRDGSGTTRTPRRPRRKAEPQCRTAAATTTLRVRVTLTASKCFFIYFPIRWKILLGSS